MRNERKTIEDGDRRWVVEAPIAPWTPYGPIGGDDAHGVGRLIRAPQLVKITAWPDVPDPFAVVAIDAVLLDGRYTIDRFEVTAKRSAVSPEAIRAVPIGRILTAGVAGAMQIEMWDEETGEPIVWGNPLSDPEIGVDVVYMLARAVGQPPTQAVAEHFGISHAAAAGRIRRRRAAGMLPATTRGKVS